jgi:hypothetical protein
LRAGDPGEAAILDRRFELRRDLPVRYLTGTGTGTGTSLRAHAAFGRDQGVTKSVNFVVDFPRV